MRVRRTPGTHAPAVLASEREILRLYARRFRGERINVSNTTNFSSGYIELLKESLVKKGLLQQKGARKFEITDRGLQAVRERGGIGAVAKRDGIAGAEGPRQDEPDRSAAGAAKVAAPAQGPPASESNGMRWTTLRGI